ncbi:helix-turn-helix domain-containing protein [Candidatus Pacearchaeota archaeon]|nr:helix-turn-helix domain-containing protein [Candidatus Pacearchaeota archaeon]
MENLPQRLREIRDARSLTQPALGKMIGVTKATIYNWESGTRFPSRANMKKLADALQVPVESLQAPEGSDKYPLALVALQIGTDSADLEGDSQLRSIPTLTWEQAALLADPKDPLPLTWQDKITLTDHGDPSAFALKIENDVMAPSFYVGDLIIVSPNTPYFDGAPVVARVKQDDGSYRAVFKGLWIEESEDETKKRTVYKLEPLNPGYSTQVFYEAPGETWIVIGVVVDLKADLARRMR